MTHPFDLRAAARKAMAENGFIADPPASVETELRALSQNETSLATDIRDLRSLPWSSIDNDSSKDLDQVEVAEALSNGEVRVRVGIADVDSLVPRGSAIDSFAQANSTSVYTGVETFPMLPEKLSTDLTSLRQDAERPVIVIEFVVAADGSVLSHDVYMAKVTNAAKLAYTSVGKWLNGQATLPPSATPAIQKQLHLQDAVAVRLRDNRAKAGALDLDTIEAQSVVHPDDSVSIELVEKTRANDLIEDFMIAANVAIAEFLDERRSPSIRRVVKTPERWNRIVQLAAQHGEKLPAAPDSQALESFLSRMKASDPVHFADLSLAVVKLIGPGEYSLHVPGESGSGHFGLATHDYTHSTAPNRRFADLVTQRLVKAALLGNPCPYTNDELAAIAAHCTEREDAARKVERAVRKTAAAISMADHIGQTFDAIVTGANSKGVFVRVIHPPIEGRVMSHHEGMDVGERVRVRLISTDPGHGYIDFTGVEAKRAPV